jgi:hypothetical protein
LSDWFSWHQYVIIVSSQSGSLCMLCTFSSHIVSLNHDDENKKQFDKNQSITIYNRQFCRIDSADIRMSESTETLYSMLCLPAAQIKKIINIKKFLIRQKWSLFINTVLNFIQHVIGRIMSTAVDTFVPNYQCFFYTLKESRVLKIWNFFFQKYGQKIVKIRKWEVG